MPEHRAERAHRRRAGLLPRPQRHPHPAERRAVCARQPLHGEPQIQIHLRAGARHRPPHPREYRKLPVHADLVHAAKADALHLRRAVAQHPRRGQRPHRVGAEALRRQP